MAEFQKRRAQDELTAALTGMGLQLPSDLPTTSSELAKRVVQEQAPAPEEDPNNPEE